MLTQSVGYAASALGCIASMGGQPILVKEIAEACTIPAPYLAKIIHALSRKGLVSTQRGVGGGVTLARDPATLTLYDLCIALDDPIVQKRCMLGTAECSDERACPAHRFWTTHRTKQLNFLQETTIAQIAAFETRRLWRSRQTPATRNGAAIAIELPATDAGSDNPIIAQLRELTSGPTSDRDHTSEDD